MTDKSLLVDAVVQILSDDLDPDSADGVLIMDEIIDDLAMGFDAIRNNLQQKYHNLDIDLEYDI